MSEMNSEFFIQELQKHEAAIIKYLAVWNDEIMRDMFPDGAVVFGGNAVACEVLQDVKEGIARWASHKTFELDEKAKEHKDSVLKGSSSENWQSRDRTLDFFALLAHLVNENEHADIMNPKTTIPEITALYAWRALSRWLDGEEVNEIQVIPQREGSL